MGAYYGYQDQTNPAVYTYYNGSYGGSTYSSTYAFYNGQSTYSAYDNPATGYYLSDYNTSYGYGEYQNASGYTSAYAVYEDVQGYVIKGVEAYATVVSANGDYGTLYNATLYEFPAVDGYATYKTIDYYSPGAGEYSTSSYIPPGHGLKV